MKKLILFFITTFLFSSNLIIQYPNLKKYYYENQIINLNIKVITPKESNLTFIPPLNSEINVTTTNNLIYNITLKYKNDSKIKKIFIIGDNIYKEITLNNLYTTKKINKINKFSNILADSLTIKNIIASSYNNKYNMISFTIEGNNTDLTNFTLNLKDENLTLITPEKATFFALVDKYKNKISFYYFNTNLENFQKIIIPINIKEETISTQTDINPEEKTIFTPINILFLIMISFLIIIFLVYQKNWLLFFPIILTLFLVYLNLPKGEIYLKRGTKIYILPTKNSTVFYISPIETKVKILKKLNNFTKIKINNKIGWVKNEDIN